MASHDDVSTFSDRQSKILQTVARMIGLRNREAMVFAHRYIEGEWGTQQATGVFISNWRSCHALQVQAKCRKALGTWLRTSIADEPDWDANRFSYYVHKVYIYITIYHVSHVYSTIYRLYHTIYHLYILDHEFGRGFIPHITRYIAYITPVAGARGNGRARLGNRHVYS